MLGFAITACLWLLAVLPAAAQDVYLPSDQVTAPTATKTTKPAYTSEAMLRRIQGSVVLQVDVLPDGTVSTVALVKSLDPGLDEEAVKAVKQWRYSPGLKNGKPVTVRVEATLPFRLL